MTVLPKTSLVNYGQYTNSDTGLIYLRARVYDPATAQFMSSDPLSKSTGAPYAYAGDSPLNAGDPYGLFSIPLIGDIGAGDIAGACGATAEVPGLDVLTCGAAGAAAIYLGYEAASHIMGATESSNESEETCTVALPHRNLPYEGEPNSMDVLDRGNGTGQIRDYGPDGLPLRDFDFGHDHGFGDPHAHDWSEGVRGPGRLAPMNSGTYTKQEVIIVLSDEFAPSMPNLACGHQIWALRTVDTERVAQQFWREHPPLDAGAGSGGITLFVGEGDPERDFLSILDDVELHHGIASSEPAVSVLRVLGTPASETIRDALCAQGFTCIESRPDGFLARWHSQ